MQTKKETKKVNIIWAIVIMVLIGWFVVLSITNDENIISIPNAEAGTDDKLIGWAWSDNIGWISFNCIDGGSDQSNICVTSDYGVDYDESTNNLSGYAWSDNVGWISFGSNGCGSQAKLIENEMQGWAKAISADDDNSWDGCISLGKQDGDTAEYGVTLVNNEFQGFAWGSDVIGWIEFNPTYGGVSLNNAPNINSFAVTSVSNGSVPTITWATTDAEECEGDWSTAENPLCSSFNCDSGSVEGPVVTEETTYILTCTGNDETVTATETPSAYYTLDSSSDEISVVFVESGATTTKTQIIAIPWNGFGSSINLSADISSVLSDASESFSIFSSQTLSSSSYNTGTEFSVYVSDIITGGYTIPITGNGPINGGIDITINGRGVSPIYEEI